MPIWVKGLEEYVWLFAGLSAITFLVSLLLVPIIVVQLPSDYFSRDRRSPRRQAKCGGTVLLLTVGKNVLGVLFIVGGIVMLILPGQGILTITVGLMLMNFPGKYRVERWLIGKVPILKILNWIRMKANKAPLIVKSDFRSF